MRIAINACQQSARHTLIVLDRLKELSEVLCEDDYDLKLIPTLSGERKILKEVLIKSKPKNVLILIGPEGDFTEDEISSAMKAGCIPVTLGDLVLRVETAAVVITSFIKLLYADS